MYDALYNKIAKIYLKPLDKTLITAIEKYILEKQVKEYQTLLYYLEGAKNFLFGTDSMPGDLT